MSRAAASSSTTKMCWCWLMRHPPPRAAAARSRTWRRLPGPSTFHEDAAAVKVDDALGDREAEAGGALAAGRLGGKPLEAAEEPRHVLRRQPGAPIGHADRGDLVAALEPDVDAGAGRAVFDGVADEVVDRLAQAVVIAARRDGGRAAQHEALAFAFRQRPVALDTPRREARRDRAAAAGCGCRAHRPWRRRSGRRPSRSGAGRTGGCARSARAPVRSRACRRPGGPSASPCGPRITPRGFFRSWATVPSTSSLKVLARRRRSLWCVEALLGHGQLARALRDPLLETHVRVAPAARKA